MRSVPSQQRTTWHVVWLGGVFFRPALPASLPAGLQQGREDGREGHPTEDQRPDRHRLVGPADVVIFRCLHVRVQSRGLRAGRPRGTHLVLRACRRLGRSGRAVAARWAQYCGGRPLRAIVACGARAFDAGWVSHRSCPRGIGIPTRNPHGSSSCPLGTALPRSTDPSGHL